MTGPHPMTKRETDALEAEPMTDTTPIAPVTQADRDAAAEYNRMVHRVTVRDADNIRGGAWDGTDEVQFFARRRLQSASPSGLVDLLREAWSDFTDRGRNPRGQLSIRHPFLTDWIKRVDAAITAAPAIAVEGEAIEQEITAWAFAHDIDGAVRNELIRRVRVLSAHPAPVEGVGLRDIASAPKDGTIIWAVLRDDVGHEKPEGAWRTDLERWRNLHLPLKHPGVADDGFDIGWNIAAPVGHGGFPDEWIAGWLPLPHTAALRPNTESGRTPVASDKEMGT